MNQSPIKLKAHSTYNGFIYWQPDSQKKTYGSWQIGYDVWILPWDPLDIDPITRKDFCFEQLGNGQVTFSFDNTFSKRDYFKLEQSLENNVYVLTVHDK